MIERMTSLMYIVLLLLITSAISIHTGKILGYSLEPRGKEIEPPQISQIKKLFPTAVSLEKKGAIYLIYDAGKKQLGRVFDSRGHADDITGYSGPTPLLIGVSDDNNIAGVILHENAETPEFFEKIKQKDLFASWKGKTVQDASVIKLDAVTGATMTSTAIIDTGIKTLEKFGETKVQSPTTQSPFDMKNLMALGVLLFALVCFFYPSKTIKLRIPLQVASIAILGFFLGWFVAMAQLYAWVTYGLPWQARPVAVAITFCALFLPLFTRKGFYCAYLCPFGASQELIGKIPVKKYKLPEWSRGLRLIIFSTITMLLLIGVSINLTHCEPFSAFIPISAATFVIAIAAFFLIISLFISRPWCNLCCPTGQLLDIVRNLIKKPLKAQKGDEV